MLPFICKLDNENEVDNPAMWDKATTSLHYNEELRREIEKEYIDYRADPVSNSAFMTKRMNIPKGNKDKTDGFMAFIAAMCTSRDLEDSGETKDFDFGVYTY